MSARKRKRYLTRGPNCAIAWAVLDTLCLLAQKRIRTEMELQYLLTPGWGNGND